MLEDRLPCYCWCCLAHVHGGCSSYSCYSCCCLYWCCRGKSLLDYLCTSKWLGGRRTDLGRSNRALLLLQLL